MKLGDHKFWYWMRLIVSWLFLAFATIGLCGLVPLFGKISAHLQFGPLLLRCFRIAGWSVAMLVIIALVTSILGRVYCVLLCPLGILQELASFPTRKRRLKLPNSPVLRYTLALVVWGCVIAGWNGLLAWLDPYSNFGRIAGSVGSVLGGITLAVFVILPLFFKRFFCAEICPVGAVLAFSSSICDVKLQFDPSCRHCGKCAMICPTGAIDAQNMTVDNSICLRCGLCLAECPVGALKYSAPKLIQVNRPDLSRRNLIKCGGILLGGAILGGVVVAIPEASRKKLSPGVAKFLPENCRVFQDDEPCGKCATVCPVRAITLRANGTPKPVDTTLCVGCQACRNVCPARPKAIEMVNPLEEEKI